MTDILLGKLLLVLVTVYWQQIAANNVNDYFVIFGWNECIVIVSCVFTIMKNACTCAIVGRSQPVVLSEAPFGRHCVCLISR